MNVFVTDFIEDIVAIHVQRFSSGKLIILLETVKFVMCTRATRYSRGSHPHR